MDLTQSPIQTRVVPKKEKKDAAKSAIMSSFQRDSPKDTKLGSLDPFPERKQSSDAFDNPKPVMMGNTNFTPSNPTPSLFKGFDDDEEFTNWSVKKPVKKPMNSEDHFDQMMQKFQ